MTDEELRAVAKYNVIRRHRRKRIAKEVIQGLAGAAFIIFMGCGIA